MIADFFTSSGNALAIWNAAGIDMVSTGFGVGWYISLPWANCGLTE